MSLTYSDDVSDVSFIVDRGHWRITEGWIEIAHGNTNEQLSLADALVQLIWTFSDYCNIVDPRNEGNRKGHTFPESCRNLAEALDAGIVAGWAKEIAK